MRTSPPPRARSPSCAPPATSPRSVREELRANLLTRLRAGKSLLFAGMLGYEDIGASRRSRTRCSADTT